MANPQLENGYLKIANELWDALTAIRIPGESMQVLFTIIRKTYGFNKKQDKIAISQFTEATGINQPNVVRAVNKLISMNIVIKKDNSNSITYSLNKDYEKWKPLSKKITPVINNDKSRLSKKITPVIKKDKSRLSKKITPVIKKDNSNDCTNNNANKLQDPKDTLKDNNTKDTLKDSLNPHQKFIEFWCLEYEKRFQVKYAFDGGKDGNLVSRLLKTFSFEMLCEMAIEFFDTTDEWIIDKGFTIGIFKSQVNKIAQRITSPNFLNDLSPTSRHNYHVLNSWLKDKGAIR